MRLHWGYIKENDGNRTYERVILARSEAGLLAKSWDAVNNRFKVIHHQDMIAWDDLESDDLDNIGWVMSHAEQSLADGTDLFQRLLKTDGKQILEEGCEIFDSSDFPRTKVVMAELDYLNGKVATLIESMLKTKII
jgi:hypothetical protein